MKKRDSLLASVFTLLLVLCAFPGLALAGGVTLSSVVSIDISTLSAGNTVTVAANAKVIISGTQAVQIVCGEGAEVTLSGATINVSGTSGSCPLAFTGSGNKLILAPGTTNTLTAGANEPAVRVEDTTELAISGSGTLNANGGSKSAGIGGGQGSSGGKIEISGGTVKATGSVNGAGIGGGSDGYCGSITISGNTDVTATGSTYGAGIGSGNYSSGDYNNVIASAVGTITITGGTVHATGGYCSAAIGGGRRNSVGTISIQGGSIYAEGGLFGAGVGSCGGGGVINISGGTVNAWSDGDGAGIGGNNDNSGDSIVTVSISGGTVFAEGGENAAGLGSGQNSPGSAPAISISGGKVYASRGTSAVYDIGPGVNSASGESLSISGDAAVFLRNDSSITPVTTTTHSHLTDNKSYGVTMPDDWTTFGAWLRLYTLSYSTNGGSGTAPGAVKQHAGTTASVETAESYTRTGYTQGSGWNTKADGSGTSENPGSTFTLNADTTLYAKWTGNTYKVKYDANGGTGTMADSGFTYDTSSNLKTNSFTRTNYAFAGWASSADGSVIYTDGQSVKNLTAADGGAVTLYAKWTAQPQLSSSKADGKIYTGGRIILTANMGGGTWGYDNSYLSADFGSSASGAEAQGTGLSVTFKALKAGTTRVTYTVEGRRAYYDITIQQSSLPQTGQDFTFVYVIAGLACAAIVFALVLKKRVN